MGKKIDMTGWVMSEHGVPDSRLTVIKEVEPYVNEKGLKAIQYLCQCSCGKQKIIRGRNLRIGNTKSCGCLATEKIVQRNIESGSIVQVGDIFGKLTVIEDLGMRKQKSRDKNWRWSLCQCECGSNPIEVPNNLLLQGHKKSCGCICSVGEFEILKILKNNNIQYIQEYSFNDLRNLKTNHLYRFDFAIFQNNSLSFLIEFDGRQHFDGPEGKWKNTRSLEDIQKADEEKNKYCKLHNITLKRIPYYNLSGLSWENILSDKWNI